MHFKTILFITLISIVQLVSARGFEWEEKLVFRRVFQVWTDLSQGRQRGRRITENISRSFEEAWKLTGVFRLNDDDKAKQD